MEATGTVERRGNREALERARRARGQNPSVVMTDETAQNRLARLDPMRKPLVTKRLAQMPPTCRNTYLKSLSGQSPAAGIKAFCMECVGWDRAEVAACTALACPLWSYRPFRGAVATERRT